MNKKHMLKILFLLSIVILTFVMSLTSALAQPILSVSSDINLGSNDANRNQTYTYDFTIKNTGDESITNFKIESSISYVQISYPELSQIPTTIPANSTDIKVRLTYVIPNSKDSVKETVGNLIFSGTSYSLSKEITLEARSYLRFDDVIIYINDDEVDDDDLEVRDGDVVRIVASIENRYSDDDDVAIENVYFKIDSDNDWDFADGEESDEEDIDADDIQDFEIEFEIDKDDVEDETISFLLEAFGDDEEFNFEHYVSKTLDFELVNPKDEILIRKITFSENPVDCHDEFVYMDVEVQNTGYDDQTQAMITIASNEYNLDWEDKVINLEIDEGDTYTHKFKIPLKYVAKSYYINVEAYNDKWKTTDEEGVLITVTCSSTPPITPPVDEEEEEEEEVIPVDEEEEEPVYDSNGLKYEEPVAGNSVFKSFWQKFLDFFLIRW